MPPLISLLANFEQISCKLSLLNALLIDFNCFQTSEITAIYGNSYRVSKKEHLLLNQQ